ncbi:plasmid mobilization protein [Mucilaginibacter sp.]|uniref:plasmid mobilization protein n=1 Tax=Mucilaginibacter sp. TaxID=1882438 RepID=UPI003D102A1D
MARPALPNSQRRVINFTIRLTMEELETLNSWAELCGKTASELVSEKIFTGHFPRPKTARIEVQTFLELKKIGVNINQQTRLLNSGRLP